MFSGKEIAESFFSDLESFFYYSSSFRVKREYQYSGIHHVSVVGTGDNFRIRISKDFCNFQVQSFEDLFFLAIMLSHECSHYLNEHNEYSDEIPLDTTAIESWADYFGARIFATVITFGKSTKEKMSSLNKEWNQKTVVTSIGKALKTIYESIYLPNTDKRYPSPNIRLLTFNAGFISFFYRLYNEIKPEFTVWVFITIIREAELSEVIYDASLNMKWGEVSDISNKIGEIHQKIQGLRISITVGMKPQYIPLLVTNYQLSAEELERNREKLLIEASKISSLEW